MVGSWLEAIHIATTVTYNSEFENETLNTKIGEQKLILEKFIMLLNNFKTEPLFGQLIDDLTQYMVRSHQAFVLALDVDTFQNSPIQLLIGASTRRDPSDARRSSLGKMACRLYIS